MVRVVGSPASQAAQAAGGKDGIAGYLYNRETRDNPSPFMTGLAKSACRSPGSSGVGAIPIIRSTISVPGDWATEGYSMMTTRQIKLNENVHIVMRL
jgi:hypothetical protein